MRQNFEKAIKFIFKWEGGYVNDPLDPGGETKYGISKRSYPNVDIRELTEQDAKDLYWRDYWDKAGCEDLPWPMCLVVLDAAVNHGVSRARKFLELSGDNWREYLLLRMAFYLDIVRRKRSQKKYIRGWLNRVASLHKEARG